MNHKIKLDIAQHARNEISSLISRSDKIKCKLRALLHGRNNPFLGEIVFIFFLLLLASVVYLFFSNLVEDTMYLDNGIEVTIAYIAIFSVVAHICIIATNRALIASSFLKVEKLIKEINIISSSLHKKLESVNLTLDIVEEGLTKSKPLVLNKNSDPYSRIKELELIVEGDDIGSSKSANLLITISTFIVMISVGIVFILLTQNFLANSLVDLYSNEILFDISIIIYVAAFIFVMVGFSVLYIKKIGEFRFGSFCLSLVCGPAAMLSTWAISGAVFFIFAALFIVVMIAAAAAVIGILALMFGGGSS